MDRAGAGDELHFIEHLMRRTHDRIDPRGFHYVHWGVIVLVWYPLANLFQDLGRPWWQLPLGIGAVLLGATLSTVREMRGPRLPGEDTLVSRQVGLITAACIGAGFVLSAVMPATGFLPGDRVPILWGLVYANLAFMTGVVYTSEFRWSGVAIFVGVLIAIVWPAWSGYILGPFMGLGMIVPGTMAERRVRRMQEEAVA